MAFLDHISFDQVYEGLASRGIVFDDEDKREFEAIVRRRLANSGDDKLLGGDTTAFLPNLLYMIISFIQSCGHNLASLNTDQIQSWFNAQSGTASTNTHARALAGMLGDINWDLAASGRSNLCAAADIVTGGHHGSADQRPEDVQWSLLRQCGINFPDNLSLNLNSMQDVYSPTGALMSPNTPPVSAADRVNSRA
jgi:hypothetical protein